MRGCSHRFAGTRERIIFAGVVAPRSDNLIGGSDTNERQYREKATLRGALTRSTSTASICDGGEVQMPRSRDKCQRRDIYLPYREQELAYHNQNGSEEERKERLVQDRGTPDPCPTSGAITCLMITVQ